MASLATTWMEQDRTAPAVAQQERALVIQAFPGEEIYFWTKKIDNARAEPRTDPAFFQRLWRAVTVWMFVLVFGLGYAVPSAYRFAANMEIQKLEADLRAAEKVNDRLKLEYAARRSPASLERNPGTYVYLNPRIDIHLPQVAEKRLAYRRAPAPEQQ